MESEMCRSDLLSCNYWHKKGNQCYQHGEDGPAIIWDNGYEQWWYYNKQYKNPEQMPLNLFLAYCKYQLK